MNNSLDFRHFRNGPGREICDRLGLDVRRCESWLELLYAAQDFNKSGALEKRARSFDGVASSGEAALLYAVLFALGFYTLADELADGRAFRRLSSASGDFKTAVAACFAGLD